MRKFLIWGVSIIGLFFLSVLFIVAGWTWACSKAEQVARVQRDSLNSEYYTD